MFLVMSPQLQFSHVVCLREIWPSPEKVWAGARHWESLWNKPRETPAREVLWDPSGLPNRAVLLLGCIKSHYFVKFQNKSNSINPKVWFAVYAVMFVIFLEKPQCKENLFFLAWNKITTGKQSDERGTWSSTVTSKSVFWVGPSLGILKIFKGIFSTSNTHCEIIKIDGLANIYDISKGNGCPGKEEG